MSLRVAVVGCGVAGSVLASMLAQERSVDLVCFEKALPSEHAEAGTGLNVGPNAMKALRLTLPQLHQAVRAASLPWARWRVDLCDGAPVFDFALTELAEETGIRIRWSELYRVLRAPLAERARFGVSIERCETDPAHPGRLMLSGQDAQGQRVRESGFDLIVSCDGRYSGLRPLLVGPWQARHIGATIYRVLVEDTSGGLIDDYAWWFNGPKRLLSFKVPPDRVYIAGSFPIDAGSDIPAAERTAAALARHYLPASGIACEPVHWLVDQLVARHTQIHWARLQETPTLWRALAGQVLFLGDSAHGMVPTLGQGATQSVEDACVAGRLIVNAARQLGSASRTPVEIAQLTARIADLREPRLRFAMDFSTDATAAMLVGADGRAEMARLRLPHYQQQFQRLWTDVVLD